MTMTPMVEGWTDEEFCREFWASLDEFYGRWKDASGGSLRDFEAAFERGKKNGIQPHPFFADPKRSEEQIAKTFGTDLTTKQQVVEHILKEHHRLDGDVESTAQEIVEAMERFRP